MVFIGTDNSMEPYLSHNLEPSASASAGLLHYI